MNSLTLYPNAKLNLGLFIKGRRPDGYHELETVFYPYTQLSDTLVLNELSGAQQPELELGGIALPPGGDNLVLRAWRMLQEHLGGKLPAVHIELHKHIPAGAGLGGGSADAAFTLRGLNTLFDLRLGMDELLPLARQLGADVPFFLLNEPCLATGIGDVLQPLELPPLGRIELHTPAIHSDTTQAYRGLDLRLCHTGASLAEALKQPLNEWQHLVFNDFEPVVFARYPALAQIKEDLYTRGAAFAQMSGSGSAVYGVFAS